MRTAFLHTWPCWFSAGLRETQDVLCVDGLRISDLIPEKMAGARGLCCYLNGIQTSEAELVYPGDHVDIAIRPGGPESIVVGKLVFTGLLFGSAILSGIAAIGALLLINKLLAKPKGPKQRDDVESTHSSWGGPQNTRVAGHPRQVPYGRYRVAPVNIDEFVETIPSPSTSTLYTLGAIGEGPVYRIGGYLVDNAIDTPLSSDDPDNPIPSGIQVNGNSLDGFREVEAHVRMGTADQEPVPGFEQIVTDYEVGATLTQEETTSTTNTALNAGLDLVTNLYNSNDPDAQAVWKAYGFGFELLEKAEAFSALIEFQRGLYRLDSSAAIQTAGFQVLVRYKEIDELGLQVDSGGDNGDGWVYQFPEPMMLIASQDPFGRDYSGIFQDPARFVPGAIGRALLFDGVNDYATTNLGANDSILQAPASWAVNQQPAATSIMGWVQFTGLSAGTYRPVVEISGVANRGIGLFLQKYTLGGGGNPYWLPTVYLGFGSGVDVYGEGESSPIIPHHHIPQTTGTTAWHHVAVTHFQVVSGQARVSIYLDGQLAYSRLYNGTGGYYQASGRALEIGRSRTFQAGAVSHMAADEFKVYARELTASEIKIDYAGGVGLYGVDADDLVAGWHFDETTGVTTMQDYGSYNGVSSGNDLLLLPAANPPATGFVGSGKVITTGSGPAKRSRYRVELLRLNLKSKSSLVSDESTWSLISGKIPEQLAYPNTALLATRIRANDQLSGSRPTTTVMVDGKLCPVWDGLSTRNPSITYQWTRNPAWIALDIATNKRYGAGSVYDFSTVHLSSVKEWADYCDELVSDNRPYEQAISEAGSSAPVYDMRYDSTLFDGYGGIEVFWRTSPLFTPPNRWVVGRFVGFQGVPFPATGLSVDINDTNIPGFEIGAVVTSPSHYLQLRYDKATYGDPWTDGGFLSTAMTPLLVGTVVGKEPRFQYDWVHDTFKGLWDTLIDVASTGRAMPFRDGRVLRFKVEKPRTPVGIIGMGQIKPGSFQIEYGGSPSRDNSYTAEYWDEDRNYTRREVDMDDPELSPETLEDDIRRGSITIEGVTRRSQAARDIYFRLLANRLLTRSGKFLAGPELLAYEPGDVFQVSHEIVPWGRSGRLLAGGSTTSVYLDREVLLRASTTYFLKVRSSGQDRAGDGTITDKYETVQVTSAAGTYASGAAITINALSFTPEKDDPYVIYSEDEIVLVQIVSISFSEDGGREVEWIEYDEDIYDCDVLPEPLTD